MRKAVFTGISRMLILALVFSCFVFAGTLDSASAADNNFTITVKGNNDGNAYITVTGAPNATYDYFELTRSEDGSDYAVVGYYSYDSVKNGSAMKDSGTGYGSKYTYIAYGVTFDGSTVKKRSKPSNEAEISASTIKKPAVSEIKVTGTTKIKLTWKKVEGATGYKIYKYDSGKGKYTLNKTISKGSTTSTTITGLTKNKKAKFKIKSVGKGGSSSYSSVVSETPRTNAFTANPSTKVADYKKGTYSIAIKKIWYDSGKIKAKLLLVNRYSKKISSFSSIKVKIKQDGTIIASQTFKDKKINLAKGKTKYITFTFNTGTKKTGRNLRYGKFVVNTEAKVNLIAE